MVHNSRSCNDSFSLGRSDNTYMRVFAWNVGKSLTTLATKDAVRQRLTMADIIILTEVGVGSAEDFAERFTLPVSAGFAWHVKPRPYKHPRASSYSGGVAIGVGPAYKSHCSVVQGITPCDGVLWVRVGTEATGLPSDLFVCGVYVQPKLRKESTDVYAPDPFVIWNALQQDVLYFRQQGFVVCGGDFNARIGLRAEQLVQEQGDIEDFARVWEAQEEQLMDLFQACDVAVDPPPPPRLSDDANGVGDGLAAEAFLQLCSMGGLLVANGRFGPPSARYTNVSQSGFSIVDYMCVDARLWSSVHSFDVLDGSDGTPWRTVSHHRPIVLGLSAPRLRVSRLDNMRDMQTSPGALALKKWQILADLA